ncbi:MAG: aminoglycoside 3'-phosphotransferase [Actinobacteria bacterium]|nr:aminoglycoside 3'-phosphotransferase [Actinomycetota bacterium]
MVAGRPTRKVVPPAVVLTIAGDRPLRVVWENEIGGLTFEVGSGDDRQFVKWLPPNQAWRLAPEAERMRWAASYVQVPEVIDGDHDADGAWLLTRGLPGDNAVSDRWTVNPEMAVRAVGAGLRQLHDRLPVGDCPFSWSADDRIAEVGRRHRAGELDPSGWHPTHQHLTVEDALNIIDYPPRTDQLVVCHGDACAPNTLIANDGTCSGHVDLGTLGVADRWADLAIATWSTEWNYGPGWELTLLDAYGIDADPERTRYYRLLWDLGP